MKTLAEAVVKLDEMYNPTCDSTTMFKELDKIKQQSDEPVHMVAARVSSVVDKYADYVSSNFTEAELQNIVCTHFRKSLRDKSLKKHLSWDHRRQPMTLDEMVLMAQHFIDDNDDEDDEPKAKPAKRELRATEEGEHPEMRKLRSQMDEIQKTLQLLLTKNVEVKVPESSSKPEKSQPPQPRRQPVCWNCGDMGHVKRKCPKELIGDGFTHQPPTKPRQKQQWYRSSSEGKPGNLN